MRWFVSGHVAAILAVVAVCAAGCGEDASPAAELEVTLWPAGMSGPMEGWTLRCEPAGGTLPAQEQACRRLDELEDPFAPVPADVACTQIFGGPEVARVEGSYRGDRVDARFTRHNGCEIARWNRLAFLIAPGGEVEQR